MKINRKIRLQLKFQSGLFVLLFVIFCGLLAWLSTQYKFSIDLTANQSNSLSVPTLRLLKNVQQQVKMTAFISPQNELKESLDDLFQRYQDQQPLIQYHSVNPDLVPEMLREFNIQREGEIVIEYNGRNENILQVTESNITNSLAGLMRQGERWVVFLQGHAERDPFGEANHDLEIFASRASQKGLHIETVDLTQTMQLPDNTDILVIADAQAELLSGELALVTRYVERGGNLLWLTEPSTGTNLETLAELLEIEFLPGVIVDPSTQLLGLDRVDYALAADYPFSPITTGIETITLYPQARAIEFGGEQSDWEAVPLILTHARTWNETGIIAGQISQDDAQEQAGPLTIAFSLTRSLQADDGKLLTQRIVVTGDSDFLSNRFVGNGSNLNLGLNMLNWLSHDDNLIAISPRPAKDTQLDLSPNHQLFIAVTFLILIPLLLLGSGISIWLIRRKR
jgi:ABC-type uncharacterized transport system involved in gliding motility auxiliary subunit